MSIDLKYDGTHIVMIPSTAEENQAVIERTGSIPGRSYASGHWRFPGREITSVREAFKGSPFKFQVFKSFKDFSDIVAASASQAVVEIDAGVNSCTIRGALVPDDLIRNACRYFWKPAVRDKRYTDKKWDGYINLYKNRTFPSGLLYIVEGILAEIGVKYNVNWLYQQLPDKEFDIVINDGLTPDPDQLEAIAAARDGLRGVLKAPTGFGKFCRSQGYLVPTC